MAILALTNVLQAATQTWDGDTNNILNTPANWSGNALPNGSGDTAVWNGTQSGSLSLTWTGPWTGGAGNNPGVNILVTSDQTGSLAMTGNTNIGLTSFAVESGAGAVSVGVGSGNFAVVFRGGSSFTNDSSNTVIFGSNISAWQSGGGGSRNIVFGGSGNWQIDGNFTNSPEGAGVYTLTKNDAGTLTLNGSQNGFVTGGTQSQDLTSIIVNAGTLKFGASAQLRNKGAGGPRRPKPCRNLLLHDHKRWNL